MSGDSITETGIQSDQNLENIAVGIVATPENTERALRAIHRAQDHGHNVIVVHDRDRDVETVRFARELGARTIESPTSAAEQTRSRELLAVASASDYDGIIISPPECERIDYPETLRTADDETFRIDPVVERADSLSGDTIVGIPAYNEAGSIQDVVRGVGEHADDVLVVDDGSDDKTAAEARAAGAVVVEHDQNQGYGQALKTLFSEANKRQVESLVVIDGDGQHDPVDVPHLAAGLDDADIVIGSRFADDGETNMPIYRRFGLTAVNVFTNLSMGVVRSQSRVRDTQSGFRAYDATVLETLADDDDIGDQMSASTDILYHAHRHGYELDEVGTTIDYDIDDTSTQHPVSHGFTLITNILNTIEQQRPMTVLGVPGFLSTVVGIGFAYWTLANYISSGAFPVGLAIVSVFFTLIGVFACFTGIILHSLNQHFD